MTKPVILFDGVCNLCNRGVQFIIKRDKHKKFLFGSLQGKYGQQVLSQNNLPFTTFNSLILIDNGKIYTRSTAVLRMLRILGRGWQLFYIFMILPKFLRDPLYNLVANNRYKWFGRREECMVPQPGWADRFVE